MTPITEPIKMCHQAMCTLLVGLHVYKGGRLVLAAHAKLIILTNHQSQADKHGMRLYKLWVEHQADRELYSYIPQRVTVFCG